MAALSGASACGSPAPSSPAVPGRATPADPLLLAITLPDWGVVPGHAIPIPWAKWRGRHGEVLDTDAPDDCTSDGGVTETESCASAVTGLDLSPRGEDRFGPRPFLEPGGLLSTRPPPLSTRPGWPVAISWTSSAPRETVMGEQRRRLGGLRPRSRRPVRGGRRRSGCIVLKRPLGGSMLHPCRPLWPRPGCSLGRGISCSLGSPGFLVLLCVRALSP